MLKRFKIVGFVLTVAACAGDGNESGGNYIPVVQAECAAASVADCAQTGKAVFVGLIETLTLTCNNTLMGLNAAQRQQFFTVSGTATTATAGAYQLARVSSWVNSTGGQQDVLNPGTYQVCAFIDTNGDGNIDTNEPVGTGAYTTGSGGTYILNTWAASN